MDSLLQTHWSFKVQSGDRTLEQAEFLVVESLATQDNIVTAGLIVNAGFGLGGLLTTWWSISIFYC